MNDIEKNGCFAYREIPELPGHGECLILKKKQMGCGTVKCPFYKPDKRYIRGEKAGKIYFEYNGRVVAEHDMKGV